MKRLLYWISLLLACLTLAMLIAHIGSMWLWVAVLWIVAVLSIVRERMPRDGRRRLPPLAKLPTSERRMEVPS